MLLAAATGCCHSASVAVHPVTNRVYYTFEQSLHSCDQAGAQCKDSSLGFKPVDAAFTDSGLVFLTEDAIYRCDKDGQNCGPAIKLKLDKRAAGIYGGTGGQVVVVSSGGQLNLCGPVSCDKVGP
jgi:hypothetical protein